MEPDVTGQALQQRRDRIGDELLGADFALAAVGTGAEGEVAGGALGTRPKTSGSWELDGSRLAAA
jgi:hypothetical protein